MNKKIKAILISICVLLLTVLILCGFYLIKNKMELSKFTPHETGKVNFEINTIKDDFVNMYFAKHGDEYLAVDAGTNIEHVKTELSKIGIDPLKVRVLLLTHSDYDHTAAVQLFPNAVVYISAPEENMIKGKVNRVFLFKNKLNIQHQLLTDGSKVNLCGWDVETIVVPGHTPGSACYIIDNQYLFTGDSLSLKNGRIEHFNDFFNMNTAEQIVSLKKISHLDNIKMLLTAHYGVTASYDAYFAVWNSKNIQ